MTTKEKSAFIIPTIDEVSDFMREKMKWPKVFCDFYASKFWHAYNSSGWRLSAGRGGLMKNWRSAFSNNWQMLKYPEDREMLERMRPRPKPVDPATLDWMTEVLEEYRANPASVLKERLSSCYDWLKEQGFMKFLTIEQKGKAIEDSRSNLLKGKETAVRFFFDYMVKNLISFNYFFNEVS